VRLGPKWRRVCERGRIRELARIAPPEKEINQLTRQFRVTKDQVLAEKHDLSASRYRHVEQEEVFYEKPPSRWGGCGSWNRRRKATWPRLPGCLLTTRAADRLPL
jgi:hypothetical protein